MWEIGDFGLCTLDPGIEKGQSPQDHSAFLKIAGQQNRNVGTPGYQAPEISKGLLYRRQVNIFAVGMIDGQVYACT